MPSRSELRPLAYERAPRLIVIAGDVSRFCQAVYESGRPLHTVYRARNPKQANAKADAWRGKGIEATIVDLDHSAAQLRAAIESAESAIKKESQS